MKLATVLAQEPAQTAFIAGAVLLILLFALVISFLILREPRRSRWQALKRAASDALDKILE